jgi:hypothetical protein
VTNAALFVVLQRFPFVCRTDVVHQVQMFWIEQSLSWILAQLLVTSFENTTNGLVLIFL